MPSLPLVIVAVVLTFVADEHLMNCFFSLRQVAVLLATCALMTLPFVTVLVELATWLVALCAQAPELISISAAATPVK